MSGDRPWQNPETLRRLYHDQGLTQKEIGDELGCSKSCVSIWMSKHDIDADRGLVMELRDEEWLREQYQQERRSAQDIADELGCSEYCVFYWLDNHNIETRESPVNQYYSVTTDGTGYERFHATINGNTRKVKHHRLLAVAEFGLSPVQDKEVHHQNNIPWDNRPSNITLVEKSEHARQHAQEKQRDSKGRFV